MSASTVAVLRGGPSSEYEVSLSTGQGVLGALQRCGYATKDVIITKSGEWLAHGFARRPEAILADVDVVFIALHGAYGEDGTVQRVLDQLGIPYTGSQAYPSSIAMHKQLTKEQLRAHDDFLTPRYMRLRQEHVRDTALTAESIRQLFGPEYVIKPTRGGSSVGTQLVGVGDSLVQAIDNAFAHSDDLLIEERIVGTEATVGVLENWRGQAVYDLPVIEIVPPASASFFSNDAKYDGTTEEICPGRFSHTQKQKLAALAKLVHQTLGLRHYSRSDFIIRGDDIYFLEVNTLPGLTEQSLFPKAMTAVGSSYDALVKHLVQSALKSVV